MKRDLNSDKKTVFVGDKLLALEPDLRSSVSFFQYDDKREKNLRGEKKYMKWTI